MFKRDRQNQVAAAFAEGQQALAAEDWWAAFRAFERAVKLDPNYRNEGVSLYGGLALAEEKLLHLTEGAKHYSLALELEGPKAEYYFGRAECLSIVGHDDDATLADLDKAISLRPGVADWHDLRAEHLALRHDRYDDALKDLEIVLADDPHDPDALGLRGFIKFNLAQYEEARPDLVAGLDSENEYNARLMLAMIASIQGETDAALGHIETLLAEAPFFWETICEHAHFALLQSHPRFLTLLSAAQEREPALDAAVC